MSKIEAMEKTIVLTAVSGLLEAGYSVSVFDGETYPVRKSTKSQEILSALSATDEESLYAFDANGNHVGNVSFVYGNDGFDVISDYSPALQSALKDAIARGESLSVRS